MAMIDKMKNWTAWNERRKAKGRRNSPKYGYCMLLTTAAPDVHDHLSDREVSTGLFLPVTSESKTGELPRALTVSQTSNKFLTSEGILSQMLYWYSAKRFSSCLHQLRHTVRFHLRLPFQILNISWFKVSCMNHQPGTEHSLPKPSQVQRNINFVQCKWYDTLLAGYGFYCQFI